MTDEQGIALLREGFRRLEASRANKPTEVTTVKPRVTQTTRATSSKPRLSARDRRLVAAIERLDLARPAFLAMAADAAEFQGDPEWDASFDIQTREHDEAQRALWTLIKPGHFRAVARGERVYIGEPGGYVQIVDVQRLPDQADGFIL